ncbi:MAG: cysteine synthase family protein [Deltaproteobacteria bacterium]|nr:cysteine synthase family protein [Deltaproteobacteria bacterium]
MNAHNDQLRSCLSRVAEEINNLDDNITPVVSADQPNSKLRWFLSMVDQTPTFEIEAIDSLTECPLLAQCELYSPTGSHKDRMYLYIIRKMERDGKIKRGMVLVDYSSGNGGASLVFVARLLGYRVIVVRPAGMSFGKAAHISALGGFLVETPEHQGVEGAVQGARKLTELLGADCCLIDQGDSQYNAEAFESLGKKIAQVLVGQGREPAYFVCAVGTGGTFTGIARELKKTFPNIRCIGVDVEGNTMLSHTFGGQSLSSEGHQLEGVSVGKIFANVDSDLIDEFVVVKPAEAMESCRLLWLHTLIPGGPSSGANLAAISKLPAKFSVTVFFDAFWKYYDNEPLFERVLRDQRTNLYQTLNFLSLIPDSNVVLKDNKQGKVSCRVR